MRNALRELAATPFYAAGWLFGTIVRGLAYLRDAAIAGYRDGRK